MHRVPRTGRALVVLASLVLSACNPSTGQDGVLDDTGEMTQSDGSLSGFAQDAQGTGIPGIHLTTDPHGYEATTDSDGAFAIDRLPPDTYRLVANGEGWATTSATDLAVLAGEQTTVSVVLEESAPPGGLVRVVVYGPDEAPLAGASVTASTGQQATTDATGQATLDDLGDTIVDLTVTDAAGALWGRTIRSLQIPVGGVAEAALTLSGRPADEAYYVGSGWCGGCHADIAASHDDTPHGHAMGQEPTGDLLQAFTDGAMVDLERGTATLAVVTDTPQVTITGDQGESRTWEVAGLIGDDREGSVPFAAIGDEAWALPVAWRAANPDFGDWPAADPVLVPFEETTWLTDDGAFTFAAGDTPAPSRSADTRCIPCHATGFAVDLREDGGVDLSPRFGEGPRWGEGQVACERCHGPGSSHAMSDPADKPFLITRPDRLDPERANEVCGQCHARTTGAGNSLPYPWTSDRGFYTPGAVLADFGLPTEDLWASGAAAAPNSQSDELALSPHGPQGPYTLRCFDCHDPHGAADDDQGQPLDASLRLDHRDNTLCSSCHSGITEAHDVHFSHEPAQGSQAGRCTHCHMPPTAARVAFHEATGAGDVASHRFATLAPQVTLGAFDAVRLEELPVGHFPIHSCSVCHEYNVWRTRDEAGAFSGPNGDPTLRHTHELYQRGWEAKFP